MGRRSVAHRSAAARRLPYGRFFLAAGILLLGLLVPCVQGANAGGFADPNALMGEMAGGQDAGQVVVGQGWEAFTNWKFVLEIFIALILSTGLAAVIAYHPRTWGKASTLEEADQPKIFIMYAIVGAIVAEAVTAYPPMAFVVFGIGGLLRFRTDVGPARDTGKVILVTIVGLACGMKIYVVAILTTAFGWVVIYLLERLVTHRVVLKGIDAALLAEAAVAYEDVLLENGFTVLSQKKNFIKGQVAFVFRAPGALDREELEELFKDIPPKLHGAPDWESN